MIGIYKITNLITGRSYIGQSLDIENRFREHLNHLSGSNIDKNLGLWGRENFKFEILEECAPEDLDRLEDYYIQKYNSIEKGYNKIRGGIHNHYESNPNHKLTIDDVYEIRESYKNHKRKYDVYEKYKDKVSKLYFSNVWEGISWKGIHDDVYTKENNDYYRFQASNGDKSLFAIFTNNEVLELRKRYINETAKEIYESVKDRCTYQSLQCILWGRYYSDIPVYDKRNKRWK